VAGLIRRGFCSGHSGEIARSARTGLSVARLWRTIATEDVRQLEDDGYLRYMRNVRGVLIDIDGTLTVSWRPLPGVVEAVAWLREQGYCIALLTNTTSRTRDWIAATLRAAGFPVEPGDILTAAASTAAYLGEHYPGARCVLLNSGDITADLPGVTLTDQDEPAPDVVILGGAGPEFSYDALNRVFAHLRGGAKLIAMGRNMYWRTDAGLQLDTGAFLAGLEQAAGIEAEVTGKPADAFFAAALAALEVSAAEAVMVGDDVLADVLAAQRSKITGVLVKTGKYLPEAQRSAPGAPDHVIDSVADLPALLGGQQ
jgi:HAD superfamily hydrolase (TIGR01458 family)